MNKTLLAAVLALLIGITPTPLAGQSVQPAMTQAEAFNFYTQYITPALIARRDDPNEIPKLRARLDILTEYVQNNPRYVLYMNDYARAGQLVLKNLYASWANDSSTARPSLHIFVPVFRDYKMTASPRQFEDYVALVFAHEMIHWELSEFKMFPLVLPAPVNQAAFSRAEATTWGLTILEIIRPMIEQGRIKDLHILDRSEELRKLGDKYHDPRWLAQFTEAYLKGG